MNIDGSRNCRLKYNHYFSSVNIFGDDADGFRCDGMKLEPRSVECGEMISIQLPEVPSLYFIEIALLSNEVYRFKIQKR